MIERLFAVRARLLVAGAMLLLPADSRAQSVAAPSPATLMIHGLNGRERVVTAAELAGMPHRDTTVSAHGVTGRYSGVPLTLLLRLVGTPHGDSLRGRGLASSVVLASSDGYRTVFALAETDSSFTDRLILVADRKNGAPLDDAEGPFRAIVPSDKRPARWARQVTQISVVPMTTP